MLAAEFTGGYPSFGFAENTDDLFVGKTLLRGDVLMWLMKTLLTSGCTNQRGAGQLGTVEPHTLQKSVRYPVGLDHEATQFFPFIQRI